MKKIIFLLLVTAASYGQTLQNPTFGSVKIKQNVTDNTATKVNVQATDGTVNTISKVDLQDAFYFASASNFPVTGITDKLYIARDNNILYRFNGTIYVPLSADVSGKEDIANKSSSFTASSTVTYANTKALVDGLATKQPTIAGTANVIPKFGTGGLVGSNIFDDGGIVSTSTDITANGIRLGRGGGNNASNLAIGGGNFNSAITATLNVAVGSNALFSNLGFANLAFGGEALYYNTTGSDNVGVGFQAGTFIANGTTQNSITAGSIYLGSGTKPLNNNETNQIVIGNMTIGAGSNSATLGNTSVTKTVLRGEIIAGTSILSPNLTGTPTAPTATAGTNTTQLATTAFVLANATNIPQLESNSTDLTVWNNGKGNVVNNTTFGESALKSNTVNGFNNTAIGFESLQANTDGDGNTSTGSLALRLNNTGGANTAIGFSSLLNTTTGGNNTALGASSLINNTTGGNNTALGASAGRFIADGVTVNQTSNTSVFLGASTRSLSSAQTNEIVIGEGAIGAGSNTATLGNTSITRTVLRGAVQAPSFIATTGTVRLKGFTVATLPTGVIGDTAYVTDALAPSYMVAVVGGGSIVTVVFYNGNSWVSH